VVDTTAAGDTGNRHRLTSSLSYETSYLYKSLVFGNFCRLFFRANDILNYVCSFFSGRTSTFNFCFSGREDYSAAYSTAIRPHSFFLLRSRSLFYVQYAIETAVFL